MPTSDNTQVSDELILKLDEATLGVDIAQLVAGTASLGVIL